MTFARRLLCLAIGAPMAAAGAYFGYLLYNAGVFSTGWTWAVFFLLFGGGVLLWSAATGR